MKITDQIKIHFFFSNLHQINLGRPRLILIGLVIVALDKQEIHCEHSNTDED